MTSQSIPIKTDFYKKKKFFIIFTGIKKTYDLKSRSAEKVGFAIVKTLIIILIVLYYVLCYNLAIFVHQSFCR